MYTFVLINVILYIEKLVRKNFLRLSFSLYSAGIKHLRTLQSDYHDKFSTHLTHTWLLQYYYAPSAVLYIPMTIFVTGNLYFLISFTLFAHSPNQPPLWQLSVSSCSLYL